jgi:hypothetical protein
VAVVAVEAGRPSAADKLILADPLQAIGVGPCHRAVHQLIHHLRIASGIKLVHKVFGRGAADGLRDPLAVAIVDHGYSAVGEHVVLEIVGVGDARRRDRVAVGVVGVGGQALVVSSEKVPAGTALSVEVIWRRLPTAS